MSVMFARLSMADGRSWAGPVPEMRESVEAAVAVPSGGRADRDVPRSAGVPAAGRLARRGHSLFGLRNEKK